MALRSRQRLGKYKIERRLAEGGFANVYQALDTIEGVRVALKVPHARLVNAGTLCEFRREARLVARLDHPQILSLKNADVIEGHFAIAFPLGIQSLEDRLQRRIATKTVLDYAEQLLEALAYAHHNRIIHCDVKPDNLVLFDDGRLRLTDFGIAKVAQRTIGASGSGTVGYMAPEQAMGKPRFASDVFSAGLVIYRMLSRQLPTWPYEWPLAGLTNARRRVDASMIDVLRTALEVNLRRRFVDAVEMLEAFRQARYPKLRLVRGTIPRRKSTRQRKAA